MTRSILFRGALVASLLYGVTDFARMRAENDYEALFRVVVARCGEI